jgi:K+-sensing histidine kinase KdpD
MKSNGMHRLRHLATLWSAGTIAAVLVTWLCFQIDASPGVTELVYLLVVDVASVFDSAISSIVLSVIAVLCLDFFFTPPIFDFEVTSPRDVMALVAFVATSLVITGLVPAGSPIRCGSP